MGFEGLIAKRKDSYCECGKRNGAWLKHKVNKSQEFVIGGYTPGNPLDAVIVAYYDGDKLIYAAKVRNGFVLRLRRETWQNLKGLEIAACPFLNLPEKKRTQFRSRIFLVRLGDRMNNDKVKQPEISQRHASHAYETFDKFIERHLENGHDVLCS